MTGPKQAPAQEYAMFADARLVTLGSDAAPHLKASGIQRNGTEISVNIVVALGGDDYLRSTLSGDVAAALVQKLQGLPAGDRIAFMTAWMGAVKTAISEAYQLNPKPAPFTYQVPPMDISVASTKQNEFRPASPPVAPSNIVIARDASKVVLQPESAAPEEKKRGEEPRGDVSRARLVSGTGTSEDPFILRFPRVVGDDDAIGSATVTLKPVLQFEGADPIYFRVELQQADFADSRFAGISKEASHLLWHQTFGPLQKAGLDARNFQIEITRQITDIFSTEKAKLEKEDRLGRYLGAN